MAHSGFKTEQCSETLNALKPFKSVFFSTGCANMMAMCNETQPSAMGHKICTKCNGTQWGWAPKLLNCPPGWGTRFLDHSDSGTIKT